MDKYTLQELAYKNGYNKGRQDALNEILSAYNSDKCVCCGEAIPEGRLVCKKCEEKANG